MRKKILIKFILSVIVIGFLSQVSCMTVPVGIAESNIPLENRPYHELGKVKGNSSPTFSVLGLWMIGRPDINEALDDAINTKESDALINLKIYQNNIWFILFGISYVTIEGDAVKFENISEVENKK